MSGDEPCESRGEKEDGTDDINGGASRPAGTNDSSPARTPGRARYSAVNGVSMYPGPTAFTVTPYRAHSTAMTRIIWLMPPLVAAYGAWFA